MSYLVLARKYRPRSFDALVGQEHVVQALANALTQQRLHHAYLFTGTRGVGKTTVSRILAKSLNCTGPDGQGSITASPCGVCDACRDIDSGRFVDYVELDAASNRGVEEISQLLDQAVYKPVMGRFKVYMIDEVHMLSTTAFNAMLKTLEEPPDYLKFVLATTDPQKVPPTVLSRCLQFNLRPMAPQTVQEHLAHVLADEAIAAEQGALRLLSRAARGSMRDALSLTDQAIAFGAGALTEAGVRQMLGAVDRGHAVRLLDALAARDGPALVEAADGLRALGLSAPGTLEEMAELLQRMAVLQAVPDAADDADPDTGTSQRLAQALAPDETQLFYSMCLHGRAELGLAPDEYSGLVMVLLRMLAFRPAGPVGSAPSPVSGGAKGAALPRATTAALQAPQAASATLPTRMAQTPPPRPSARVPEVVAPAPMPRPPVQAETAGPASKTAATARRKIDDDIPPWVDAPHGDAPADAMDESLAPWEDAPAPAPTVVADEPAPVRAPPPSFERTPLGDRWDAAVSAMVAEGRISALVRELAIQAQCTAIDAQAEPPCWHLRVEREMLRAPIHCEKLQAALSEQLHAPVRLQVEGGSAQDTPAQRAVAERERRQREAEDIIHNDPMVRSLMTQFKTARIVPGSVSPC